MGCHRSHLTSWLLAFHDFPSFFPRHNLKPIEAGTVGIGRKEVGKSRGRVSLFSIGSGTSVERGKNVALLPKFSVSGVFLFFGTSWNGEEILPEWHHTFRLFLQTFHNFNIQIRQIIMLRHF